MSQDDTGALQRSVRSVIGYPRPNLRGQSPLIAQIGRQRDSFCREPTSTHEGDQVVRVGSQLLVHKARVAGNAVPVHPGLLAVARLRERACWEQADLETQVRLLRERIARRGTGER